MESVKDRENEEIKKEEDIGEEINASPPLFPIFQLDQALTFITTCFDHINLIKEQLALELQNRDFEAANNYSQDIFKLITKIYAFCWPRKKKWKSRQWRSHTPIYQAAGLLRKNSLTLKKHFRQANLRSFIVVLDRITQINIPTLIRRIEETKVFDPYKSKQKDQKIRWEDPSLGQNLLKKKHKNKTKQKDKLQEWAQWAEIRRNPEDNIEDLQELRKEESIEDIKPSLLQEQTLGFTSRINEKELSPKIEGRKRGRPKKEEGEEIQGWEGISREKREKGGRVESLPSPPTPNFPISSSQMSTEHTEHIPQVPNNTINSPSQDEVLSALKKFLNKINS